MKSGQVMEKGARLGGEPQLVQAAHRLPTVLGRKEGLLGLLKVCKKMSW